MESVYGWIRPILIIAFLAAPALLQRMASHFSDDPYLQPLALTKEALANSGERVGGGTWIDVEIAWGRDFRGSLTPEQLRGRIANAFRHQTDKFFLDLAERPGSDVAITFRVGPNRYGPYPPGGMVGGIETALIAFRMTEANKPNPLE